MDVIRKYFSNHWDFFHCIRKTPFEPYVCKQINSIYFVKLPDIDSDEYLIPICNHVPISLKQYQLEKYLKSKIKVKLISN